MTIKSVMMPDVSEKASGIHISNPCNEIALTAKQLCTVKYAMSYLIPHAEQLHLFEPTPALARETISKEGVRKAFLRVGQVG